MADGRDGLVRFAHLADDGDDPLVQAQIFRSAAAGQYQGVVVGGLYLVEIGVDGEVVALPFQIGLIAGEIVNGRGHRVAGLFAGADGVHLMPGHDEHLKGNHSFIIFHKIAHNHQNALSGHQSNSLFGDNGPEGRNGRRCAVGQKFVRLFQRAAAFATPSVKAGFAYGFNCNL